MDRFYTVEYVLERGGSVSYSLEVTYDLGQYYQQFAYHRLLISLKLELWLGSFLRENIN